MPETQEARVDVAARFWWWGREDLREKTQTEGLETPKT